MEVLDRMVNYDFRSRYGDAMEALKALESLQTANFGGTEGSRSARVSNCFSEFDSVSI